MSKKERAAFILFFPFLFFPYLCGNYANMCYVNYGIFLLFASFLLIISSDRPRLLLSPAFVTAFYLYICFFIGDLLLRDGIYLDYRHYEYYSSWSHHQLSNTYTNLAVYIALLSYYICPKHKRLTIIKQGFDSRKKNLYMISILWAITLLVIIKASESVASAFVSIACVLSVALIYTVKINVKNKYRFLIYLIIIFAFAIADADDKRNSIFLFYVLALVELPSLVKIRLKHIIYGIVIVSTLFFAVISMSVIRATDGRVSTSDLIQTVPQYLTSETAIAMVANNFEVDYTYIDTFQPIEFVANNPTLKMWGESYIKPFFLIIPRSLMPNKPESAMIKYTKEYDYGAAVEGYCLPICISTEAFWNFGSFGLIVVFIIYYFLNSFYCFGLNTLTFERKNRYTQIGFLFIMYLSIMLIRGSGLDIFVLQSLIGLTTLFTIRLFIH